MSWRERRNPDGNRERLYEYNVWVLRLGGEYGLPVGGPAYRQAGFVFIGGFKTPLRSSLKPVGVLIWKRDASVYVDEAKCLQPVGFF